MLKKRKEMSLLYAKGNKSLFVYYPTLFSPLCCHFEKMTVSRRIRLMLEFLAKGHYQVYYLKIDDDIVGYCVVAPGNRRLKLSMDDDIVLGPYYTAPEFRGLGYAKCLICLTLQHCRYKYQFAYDYINKENISSIKATLANGFVQCGELDIVGFFHKLVVRDSGEYNIYIRKPVE